ncbi:MAG: hypothetical protein ACFBRM_13480 [Pikeienuella sp.]
MRCLLTALLVGSISLPAVADPSQWAAALHAEAMARVPAYANEGNTKAMIACIHWPGDAEGSPRIAFVTTRISDIGLGKPVPIQRLRMNAMRDCLGRAGAVGCDCASLDEAGRNTLRLPR